MGVFENAKLSSAAAALLTSASWLLGGYDEALITLTIFIALDFITGVARAGKDRELTSNRLLLGLVKKLSFFALIILAVRLEMMIDAPLRELVIFFLIANEGLSILANLSSLGVPIPEALKNALESMRKA